jgi:DNA repair photolyase
MRFRMGITDLLTDLGCSMTSVTPYALCDYRCVYCITGVQGASKPMMSAEQAVAELREHLATAPSPPMLLIGALSDAYPSVEREFGVTRSIVAHLVDADVPFTIVTKSDIILRDLDLLVAHGDRAHVQVSICSVDDDVLRLIDRSAPSGTVRFGVIDKLHRAGVRVDLNLLPWIPDVSDTEAVIARVPSDVEVVVGPLAFGPGNDRRRLVGRTYTRDEVWARYMVEYARFGHIENTSWIEPSLPPEENNPLYRLPVLQRPGGARAVLAATAEER